MATTALVSQPSQRPEWRVSSLKANIVVNPDSSLLVDEILVIPENSDPNFGLRCVIPIGDDDRWDRNFGPGYTEDNGLRFKIKRVTVDGTPVAYRLDHSLHHFYQVIVGEQYRSYAVGPGAHELNVVYAVTGAIRFAGQNDELYWNAAGHSLPIVYDSVSVRVELPAGVPGDSVQTSSYAGHRGVTDAQAGSRSPIEATAVAGGAEFNTENLRPHESLSMVVRWPQGYVHRPRGFERYSSPYYLAPLLLLLLYVSARAYLRRNMQEYSTAPQYEPPQGLSPAALRYITRGAVDGTSVAATLTSLAVGGYIEVEARGKSYQFRRTPKCDTGLSELPPEQAAIVELMFDPNLNIADPACGTASAFPDSLAHIVEPPGSGTRPANSVAFGPSDPRINVLAGAIYTRVKPQLDGKYFRWNAWIVLLGMLATLIFGMVAVGMAGEESGSLFLAFWTFGFFQGFSAILGVALYGRQRKPVVVAAVSLALTGITFLVARQLARDVSWLPVSSYIAMIVLNGIFLPLLRTPTGEGQKLLSQIHGYRVFLEETERDRLSKLGKTFGFQPTFASLPYAIALDLKEPWGDAMADAFFSGRDDVVTRELKGTARGSYSALNTAG